MEFKHVYTDTHMCCAQYVGQYISKCVQHDYAKHMIQTKLLVSGVLSFAVRFCTQLFPALSVELAQRPMRVFQPGSVCVCACFKQNYWCHRGSLVLTCISAHRFFQYQRLNLRSGPARFSPWLRMRVCLTQTKLLVSHGVLSFDVHFRTPFFPAP